MATQFDPIAKDESLNTTETPSRNIADVLAEELSGIASALTPTQLASLADVTISSPSSGQTLKYNSVTQKWENANDAGGHTIENPSGTDMTQRANLQFVDAHLTDDSVNDRTEIENIKDITSADYASATEDGFYNVTDESDEELTAADIAYDSNDSIKEKIDELSDASVHLYFTESINLGNLSWSSQYGKYYTTVPTPADLSGKTLYSAMLADWDALDTAIVQIYLKSDNSIHLLSNSGTFNANAVLNLRILYRD